MKLKVAGYTLVELLVSMSISLLVLSAAIALFSVNSSFGGEQLQRDLLRSQLNLLSIILVDEISRAGFCYDCTSSNPYILESISEHPISKLSAILIDDKATTDQGRCIRFAYNHNKRNNPSTIHEDDRKGYRLDTKKNVIEMYENYGTENNWSCSKKNWMDITNESLRIDEFTFTRASNVVSGTANTLQNITMKITASLASDNTIKDSVNVTFNVYNIDG